MKKLIISIFVSCAAMCSVSALADDYLPMLREGVQWVNRYIIREHAEPSHYGEQSFYSYEIKGDTTVNGVAYKKCHYYPGEAKTVVTTASLPCFASMIARYIASITDA